MIKNTKIFSFLILVIFLPTVTFADTASSSSTSGINTNDINNTSTQPVNIPTIIVQIQNAKNILASTALDHVLAPVYKNVKNSKTKKTTKVISSYSLIKKEIALAVLDPQTQQTSIVKGWQSGKNMTFNNPDFDISLVSFNGVNSKFQINKPNGGTVLALKYLISKIEKGTKTSIENSLSEAVYVPYSINLNKPEIALYGENYISGIIKNVAEDIKNLPSQSVSGKTIPQAINPSLIRALVYAEHTDTSVISRGNVNETINQLNILFATNLGDAYKYSVSSAGARGIAQFMPATYNSLVNRHPEASLISDFVSGMNDHYNSIKAMYLLLDDYAGAVRVKAQNGFAEGQVFDYGAASYNGGVARVTKAINTFGQDWNKDQSNLLTSLQSQASSLKSQVSGIKNKIKNTSDKKTKNALLSQLNSTNSQLASANSQIQNIKSGALRNETVNYLQKIYKVIPVFNDNIQI